MTPGRTTRDEAALLRLVAQRVVGPSLPDPVEAARWLLAAQGQELPGALASLALRTTKRSRADVVAAFGSGALVRSWPMRGTLHVVAAEDLDWLLGLTRERLLAASVSRRRRLGLSPALIEQAVEVARTNLAGGQALSRAELLAAWQEAGLALNRPRATALLNHLAECSVLCLGPLRGGEQLVVLVAAWIPRPRRLAGDAALAEIALRYFRSHGPAGVRDLAWWSRLRLSEARTGIALVRDRLLALEVDGEEMFLDPATPDLLADHRDAARGLLALPGFDEIILGYGQRTTSMAPDHLTHVVPGRNGVFRPTLLDGGQVVATWRRATAAGPVPGAVHVEPVPGLPDPVDIGAARTAIARVP